MGKVYAFFAAIAATAIALFVAFQKGAAAGRDKVVAKVTAKSIKQQQKATAVMLDGLEKEQEVRNAEIDTDKRDHFSK